MQLSELLIRAFKDQKCPQWPNVLGLTLCVRRRIQTQPKNTSSSLLCPNLEKPRGSSKNCHNPVSFTRKKKQVWSWLSSFGDLDTWSFSWKTSLWSLWERLAPIHLLTFYHQNVAPVQVTTSPASEWSPHRDKSQICKWQSNCESETDQPVSVALFYICSLFFPQSCRIA